MQRAEVEFRIKPKTQSQVLVRVLSYLLRLDLQEMHVDELVQVTQSELQGEHVPALFKK